MPLISKSGTITVQITKVLSRLSLTSRSETEAVPMQPTGFTFEFAFDVAIKNSDSVRPQKILLRLLLTSKSEIELMLPIIRSIASVFETEIMGRDNITHKRFFGVCH